MILQSAQTFCSASELRRRAKPTAVSTRIHPGKVSTIVSQVQTPMRM